MSANNRNIIDIAAEEEEVEAKGLYQIPKRIPWWKSIPSDILKGTIEASERVGRMMGPLIDEEGRSEAEIQQELTERLDELIPSDKTFVGATARRGIKTYGPMTVFPGKMGPGMVARGAVGAVGAQTLEELGAPEWLQTIAEVAPFFAPGMAGKLQPTKAQKPIVGFLRKYGATEKEITPLLQQEKRKLLGLIPLPSKEQFLSKFARKGERVTKAMQATKRMLGNVYDGLRMKPEAQIVLEETSASRLIRNLQNKLQDLPAKARNAIAEDFALFEASPKDGKSMIKLWQDIGANFKTHPELGTLKGPLRGAMHLVNPELGKDFELTNKLYQKYLGINSKLTSKAAERLDAYIDVYELGRLAHGVFFGSYPYLVEALGETAGRSLMSEMLTNPRFQRLSNQMVQALNKGKYAIANSLNENMIKFLGKDHPEAAAELKKVDFEDIEKYAL